ncbi:MazG-like family protein [Zhaonella formicivorans]|uniref:MazG-like family protein n=1 Tax=Zhaonella formicivorans TaxID=2528593 RepID=UPI0010E8FD28|nr:MazG-like family protein [Zhaonella formicivorans]
MGIGYRELDITRNLRMIEWLKADLISSTGALFKAMVKGSQEAILDALGGVIISAYILGKRVGINFVRIDLKLVEKLRREIAEGHAAEEWYGDLSALLNHLEVSRR